MTRKRILNITILLCTVLLCFTFLNVSAQCLAVRDSAQIRSARLTRNDSIKLILKNNCDSDARFVLSVDVFYVEENAWREVDWDIQFDGPYQMKVVSLPTRKGQIFKYLLKVIDPVLIAKQGPTRFRILANIYSKDHIEITNIYPVCFFQLVR